MVSKKKETRKIIDNITEFINENYDDGISQIITLTNLDDEDIMKIELLAKKYYREFECEICQKGVKIVEVDENGRELCIDCYKKAESIKKLTEGWVD